MPNLVNQLICEELEQEFAGAEGMVLVAFGGLTVEENEAVRNKLAAGGAKFRMVPNKLARRVLDGRGLEFPAETFKGNVAVAYGGAEHAITAAKIFSEPEVKKAGKVKFRAGMLEGRVLGADDAAALADIPDRSTLQAQLLGCISGPARSLASVINAVPGSVARVLQARVDKQDGAAEG